MAHGASGDVVPRNSMSHFNRIKQVAKRIANIRLTRIKQVPEISRSQRSFRSDSYHKCTGCLRHTSGCSRRRQACRYSVRRSIHPGCAAGNGRRSFRRNIRQEPDRCRFHKVQRSSRPRILQIWVAVGLAAFPVAIFAVRSSFHLPAEPVYRQYSCV